MTGDLSNRWKEQSSGGLILKYEEKLKANIKCQFIAVGNQPSASLVYEEKSVRKLMKFSGINILILLQIPGSYSVI